MNIGENAKKNPTTESVSDFFVSKFVCGRGCYKLLH